MSTVGLQFIEVNIVCLIESSNRIAQSSYHKSSNGNSIGNDLKQIYDIVSNSYWS